MSQIKLDTSPYFDDFDEDKDYYKVLFKPGFPVQARELTTLQSILQNQISSFGEHFFKEGSMVVPGAITYNPKYDAVILNQQQSGVDISLYLEKVVGKTVRGAISGIRAKVIDFLLPPNNGVEQPTIYVTYIDSGVTNDFSFFNSNEPLILEEAIVYGNTTITPGSVFASTISIDATKVGSSASISDGIYFVRGTFVRVGRHTIILDPYSNTPSFRVGVQILEKIVTAGQDNSLYDNAKGFDNFSAPGADRLEIKLVLTKKPIDDFLDIDFIELLRVENGEIKKLAEDSEYNIIKDYLAKRTYDESGDYSINGLKISVNESLSDGIGNGGVYSPDQKTKSGETPSDDLAVVRVSSGKAYVGGYDIKNPGTVNIDSPKPRTTEEVVATTMPFEMGSKYIVNNVIGSPLVGLDYDDNFVNLFSNRKGVADGEQIGVARVYSFGLEDAAYTGASTSWELYLFDVQLFTKIRLNSNPGNSAREETRIVGNSSGARSFVQEKNGRNLTLVQVSGNYQRGETITLDDGVDYTIDSVEVYGANSVRSITQGDFSCDTRLTPRIPTNFTAADNVTITPAGSDLADITCAGKLFNTFRVNDIISYQKPGQNVLTYNRVTVISDDEQTLSVRPTVSVNGVCDGSVPAERLTTQFRLTESRILNQENSFLYAVMKDRNIASANLSSSNLIYTTQIPAETTDAGGTLVSNASALNTPGSQFIAFDQERYSVIYSDGTIASIDANNVSVTGDEISISGLTPNASGIKLNVTAIKTSVKSKTKINTRSVEVELSKISNRNPDFGMSYSRFYGTRVNDDEVCLNFPDVNNIVAIYESLDSSKPVLDIAVFASGLDLDTDTIKGEIFTGTVSGAKARLVSTPNEAEVRFIYLTQSRFQIGEEITFEESNVITNLQQLRPGNYNNITDRFILDKGQRQEFYDYSRIVRKRGATAPNKKLLVILDRFEVPENDKGDFYTANSYSEDDFGKLVPMLDNGTIRASDTLDFRPRVPRFTSTSSSPFFYTSRDFATAGSTVPLVVAPNEGITLGYNYYLGRIDRVILDRLGEFSLVFGAPSVNPTLPVPPNGVMELAQVEYPPYVYDVSDIRIKTISNRRYTMKDIGSIADRVETLEEVTSLSLLERETESLQVLDRDGNNRFKSGFFADDFRSTDLVDFENPDTQIDINTEVGAAVCFSEFATLPLRLQFAEGIDPSTASLDQNIPLIDSNTRKTGDLVTLDYREVEWIKQPLASRIENVNPFNVILYTGNCRLNPRSDDFIITRDGGTRRINVFGDADQFTREFVTEIEVAQFMRQRNVAFSVANLKSLTEFYTFFDGTSGIDVIPKLIEVNLRSGTFEIGETVRGFDGETEIFSARVVAPNHKTGDANNASRIFTESPYDRQVILPDAYSASTPILNIDLNSLADISDDRFAGFITTGTRLVGSSSGAVADVGNVRLVTDTFGELFGAVFFRDPYTTPAPAFRLETGIRSFRISSSPTNETPTLGSTVISFSEATYESRGTVQVIETEQVTIRELPPPPPPVIIEISPPDDDDDDDDEPDPPPPDPVPIDNDPLAQTFRVDGNGAFLTSVDIYMATKATTDNLTVQIRPTTLATPENFLIQDFAEVVLSPDQVEVSDDGSIPTHVEFSSPIYLEPGVTYALVLLAPTTNDYNAYVARMGEADIQSSTASSGDVIISQQYLNGSLFKSQNGSIWTPSQFEDLKFTLYKAAFTQRTGTVYLNNPPIGRTTQLSNNPITTLPRKIKVPVDANTYAFENGQRVASTNLADPSIPLVDGVIESLGGAAVTLAITAGGTGYAPASYSNVKTINVSGNGSNLTLNLTITDGAVTGAVINQPGSGYRVGDTVRIDNSDTDNFGGDDVITISEIGDTDTLYLTNVNGEFMSISDQINIVDTDTLIATGVLVNDTNIISHPMNDGNIFVLNLPSHGMESDSNIIDIFGVKPDTVATQLIEPIDLTTNEIVVADPSLFDTFEGITTSTGYAYLGGEVIEYLKDQTGSITITDRGVDDTAVLIHDQGTRITRYEASGVSLRRINTTLELPTDSALGGTRDITTLPLRFDRTTRGGGPGMINFNQEQEVGGVEATTTQNFQFNRMLVSLGLLTPGSNTSINATIRTISGTSDGGNEESFVDQGFEAIDINGFNTFLTPRMIASRINELQYVNSIPQNRSLTIALNFNSSDINLSPIIDIRQANAMIARSVINNPIEDYTTDGRVNKIIDDPHSSIYISERINIQNPSTSLQVILSAYRDESADFRVLYRLFGPETQGSTEPTWVLFPGYDNLVDNDGDGAGDTVVDPSKNSGLPNQEVRPSAVGEVLEYSYAIDNLPEFAGFQIKVVFSGTNEARAPFMTDIRAIALA